jgi:hypothetical protein
VLGWGCEEYDEPTRRTGLGEDLGQWGITSGLALRNTAAIVASGRAVQRLVLETLGNAFLKGSVLGACVCCSFEFRIQFTMFKFEPVADGYVAMRRCCLSFLDM